MQYPALAMANLVEVGFAFSGILSQVHKKPGQLIKKGDIIASLDKKMLQAELDRQLADYERKRAEFEIFALKHSELNNQIEKYEKTISQAQLNASVKDVEICKSRLDLADLISPIDGYLINSFGLVPGMFVSPSAHAVALIDLSTLRFQIEIGSHQAYLFTSGRPAVVQLESPSKKLSATSHPAEIITLSKAPYFTYLVDIVPEDMSGIFPGMEAMVEFTS